MTSIIRKRREWFGGLVYSENPGFTAFVDHRRADTLGIPSSENLTEGLFSAPLDVHMSITDRCNLHCRGCYALRRDAPAADMASGLARGVIDRLADMGVFTISFGGGEPFLHPHLFDIAAYSRRSGIVPNVTTNGLLIDPETARRCQVFGSVHVSCHHPSELPRLVEPVRLLKRSGTDVGLNVLISSMTYSELPSIWRWCAAHDLTHALLLKFKVTKNNQDCRDMELSLAQERSLPSLIRQLSRRFSIMPMLDCSFFPALASARPRKTDLEFFDVNGCTGANAILSITTDGQFRPCSFCGTTCGDARLLDCNTWRQNEDLVQFRQHRSHAQCASCAYGDLCNGGCRVSETRWCRPPEDVNHDCGFGQVAPLTAKTHTN